jgi:ParB family chromosome partitioning protein
VDDPWNQRTSKQSGRQRRGGLGRGLGSLIPTGPAPDQAASEPSARNGLSHVSIDVIRPNPFQPRLTMKQEQLEELAASIRTHGVMQPLVVSPVDGDGMYTLIAGERRWRASMLAGLEVVPIVEMDATPQSMLELAIIENVVRADLSPLEEAHAYRRLIEDFHLTQGDVAERVGKSRVAITNTLRLLNAPEQVQQALVDGEITEGHARALLGATALADQLAILAQVQTKNLNVRQTESMVRTWMSKPGQREFSKDEIDPETARIEATLRSALNTRVTLKRGGGEGGTIAIEFFSDEHLNAICARLVEDDLW